MVGITMSGNFSLGRLRYDMIPARVMITVKTKTLVLLSILQLDGLNSFS
jgi:hypothetical protein